MLPVFCSLKKTHFLFHNLWSDLFLCRNSFVLWFRMVDQTFGAWTQWCNQIKAEEIMPLPETNLLTFLLVLYNNLQLSENKQKKQLDSIWRQWPTMSLTGPLEQNSWLRCCLNQLHLYSGRQIALWCLLSLVVWEVALNFWFSLIIKVLKLNVHE